ncbi:PP2C family protein-serine/threonine phosphatase [Qiania dongpingensis]|uniref:SpoIIE family protein phosphatase n=1 Tax=Qiania dongpingensis TaxID=2763669 RepID=A0A7G9G3E9_9FIRM|nr:SpoIIE family protein phosphatase [Qiania dongpingensis]QNM05331.1 SpoIIE family protein phosphatase [Qiania dongpingensis]
MNVILDSLRDKKNWLRLVLSAVLFFAVALPFRQLLSLMPGITEIRPANVIPPVLGLMWGPAAAFGTAIGNLISDMISGSNAFVCIMGFLANFFYAYLPYKLWYSFRVDEKDLYPTLGSVRKILKYIYVILLDSLVVTGMLSLIFETAGFSGSGSSYALLFFNNFDFAVLLGVPILIFLERFHPDYYVPGAKRRKKGSYLRFDCMLFAAAALGLGWFWISFLRGAPVESIKAPALLAVSMVLVFPSVGKPFNFDKKEQLRNIREVKTTIKTKVVIGFLMLAVIFIAFVGLTAYHSQTGDDTLTHWRYVYQIVGLAINIIFAVAIVFLWYVERNIVDPLERLAENVREFAAQPADSGEIPEPKITDIDTGDEITLLADSCNTMMRDITAYMHDLRAVTAEKERIGAELSVATEIQASMLPCIFPAFPERPEFDIYATMTPAKEVGGDFYDFFLVDDDHLAIVIADVSGKGVPAALFMVIAKTLLKNCAQTGLSPKAVLEKVNNQLCENNEAQMFVTVWLGILEISAGRLTCANAGHEYPALRKDGGDYELVKDKHGFVLAGMEDARYREYELELGPGDSLYVYTDGVAEATDGDNTLFGTERMLESLNRHKEAAPGEFLSLIKEDIDAFVGSAPQFDDITMVSLRLRGAKERGS